MTRTDRPTVIVLEDEADARDIICEALERDGFRVIAAATALDALAAGRRETWIDLLVADLRLPDGDGGAVAMSLASAHDELSTILLSGSAPPRLERRQRFVAKPARMATILREAHAALEAGRAEPSATIESFASR